jgi:hypothetical protein
MPETRPHASHRLRFELILGSVLLAVGLFAVPAVVYLVGIKLLGPYGDGAGLATFYGDFFGDLASGVGRAWSLTLGPLVLISLLRSLFLRRSPVEGQQGELMDEDDDGAPQKSVPRAPPSGRRKEPSVTLD